MQSCLKMMPEKALKCYNLHALQPFIIKVRDWALRLKIQEADSSGIHFSADHRLR